MGNFIMKVALSSVIFITMMGFVASFGLYYAVDNVVCELQDVSVNIQTERGQGSGTMVQREINGQVITYVWTAAHVVESARHERKLIDSNGNERTTVYFDDVDVVVEYLDGGIKVGKRVLAAKVIKYTNSETGEDLALLRVRLPNAFPKSCSAKFQGRYYKPAIGTELCHCGCLYGEYGQNSFTTGVLSKLGRMGWDQITVVTFPGSSGGGVHLRSDGSYVGMLVRGHKVQGFNLMVPVRRMHDWAAKVGIEWALRDDLPVPPLDVQDMIVTEEDAVVKEAFKFSVIPASLRSAGKNRVIFHFYAPWCGACKRMQSDVFSQKEVKEAIENGFILRHINTDTEPLLARKYTIHSLPTDIILDAEGHEIARHVGYMSAREYVRFLEANRE